MGYLAFVDIDDVAYVLEGEERDADWQEDFDGDAVLGAEGGVEDVGEEVGIFEKSQYRQVDGYARGHQCFAQRLRVRTVHCYAEQPSQQGAEDQKEHEQTGCLVVEKEAHGKEIGVAHHETAALAVCDDGEAGVDDEQKHPKVDLGEEQRVGTVETDKLHNVFQQVVQWVRFSLLMALKSALVKRLPTVW